MPLQQKQYLTHYAPMIKERRALHIFKKAGFTPESTRPISRSAIECACCEVCFLYYGLEPDKTEPPFDDMYIWDFCNWTYHSACLKNTGCYTERQREGVDKNDNWACPACADLTAQQEQKRSYESYDKELIKVTWKPTWEPEVTKNKWPRFHKHILDFEACQDEPNLTMPAPDETISNLERQGFAREVTDNTWNYKRRYDQKKSCLWYAATLNLTFNQIGNAWSGSERSIAHVKMARTEAHRIDPEIPISPANYATLPQASHATRACTYTPDGKHVSMLSTEL